MEQFRVSVVVNKWWECDPVMNVLLHQNASPVELHWAEPLKHPRPRPDQKNLPSENTAPVPRGVFKIGHVAAEVWCISDLLEDLPDKPEYQSSSERKMERLPRIFREGAPDLVVAVGTAGYPSNESENGSVVIGTKVFMHNAHAEEKNEDSNWTGGPFDQIIDSSLDRDLFDRITTIETSPKASVLDRFLVPPLLPASRGHLLARYDHVSLGTVNVTKYEEYATTDKATVDAFTKVGNVSRARSLETTHGLIRVTAKEAPFLFASGITDRVGHFDEEVAPRAYAQNTAAAHNAGICVAWLLRALSEAGR